MHGHMNVKIMFYNNTQYTQDTTVLGTSVTDQRRNYWMMQVSIRWGSLQETLNISNVDNTV